jgi:pyruvate/2-oxoglutarate dehydrogenase complex dihydrolipoamide acyltransferase (E2) component
MPETVSVPVPQMNANDDQAVIVAWRAASGSHVTAGDAIATLETTKATFDVNAPRTGYLYHKHEIRSVVDVGSTLAWICDDPRLSVAALDASSVADRASAPAAQAPLPGDLDTRLTRKAARRMRELGVRAGDLPEEGRLGVADIERIAAGRGDPVDELCAALEQSTSKIMEVARLTEVYRCVVPSVVTVPLRVDAVKARLQALAVDTGPVSLLELLIREAALVLQSYPELNGYHSGSRAWTYRSVAIGFAVNAGKGLRVPVVRKPADLSQLEVCRSVRNLTLRYFRDELSVDDVAGGTFTVTDLSGHGVTHFIPVLNDRQSAILGVCAPDLGGVQQNLVLAFDHRMADGMRAGEFLRDLRDALEA